jgi:hypothetical protein
MAKLDKTNVVAGNVIQSTDIANIYNALGGTGNTDIVVSGSLSAVGGLILSHTATSDPSVNFQLYTSPLSASFGVAGAAQDTVMNAMGSASSTTNIVVKSNG